MNDEKKNIIPLDSQFDINSNDMLVPVDKPKFSFNRQRFLGSVLQNSVRYEADGYFAGWWVHNFDLVSIGDITIEPDSLGFPEVQGIWIPGQQLQKYWNVKFPSQNISFKFNPQLYSYWTDGTGSIVRNNDTELTITGTTNKGIAWSVDVDTYTGEVIPNTFVCSDSTKEPVGWQTSGVNQLLVESPFVEGMDQLVVRFGSDLSIEGILYPYNYDSASAPQRHTWGNFIQVGNAVGDVPTVIVNDDIFTFVSASVANAGDRTEEYTINVEARATYRLKQKYEAKLVGGFDVLSQFSRNTQPSDGMYVNDLSVDSVTGHDQVNEELPQQLASGFLPGTMHFDNINSWGAYLDASWKFPIWIKIGNTFNIGCEIDIIERRYTRVPWPMEGGSPGSPGRPPWIPPIPAIPGTYVLPPDWPTARPWPPQDDYGNVYNMGDTLPVRHWYSTEMTYDEFLAYYEPASVPAGTYTYIAWLRLAKADPTSSTALLQNYLNMPVRWEYQLNNGPLTNLGTLGGIDNPLYIQINTTPLLNTAAIPPMTFMLHAVCDANDPNYPVPSGQYVATDPQPIVDYEYGRVLFTAQIELPAFRDLPPPPPPWVPNQFLNEWYWMYPDRDIPIDWANPVPYPVAWPPELADWTRLDMAIWQAGPADWPDARFDPGWCVAPADWGKMPWPAAEAPGWPTQGLDWPYPMPTDWPDASYGWTDPMPADWPRADFAWPAQPANWDTTYPWPPEDTSGAVPPYGLADNETSGIWTVTDGSTYLDYYTATKPANWPDYLIPVFVDILGDGDGVFVPPWDFGSAIPGTERWYSAATTYDDYYDSAKPAWWPDDPILVFPVVPSWLFGEPEVTGEWYSDDITYADYYTNNKPYTWWPDDPILPVAWPPSWDFGQLIPAGDGFYSSTAYEDYYDANKPANWPDSTNLPFDPAWPPVDAAGDEYLIGYPLDANDWYSIAITYDDYYFGCRPTYWPPTPNLPRPWPPIDAASNTWYPGMPLPATGEWWSDTTYQQYYDQIKLSNNWPTVPSFTNPLQRVYSWPPQWAFGTLYATTNRIDWFSTITSYPQIAVDNTPANWPIPWSGVPRFGYVPPLPVVAGVPVAWTPPWPIKWPLVGDPPPGWYSQGTSYIDYVTAHIPYKPPGPWAENFNQDPGYQWPGQDPTDPHTETGRLLPVPATQTDHPWPYFTPAGYTLVTAYNPVTGAITFNNVVPDNWPKFVTMNNRTKAQMLLAVLGEDVDDRQLTVAQAANNTGYWADKYRGRKWKILNRASVLPSDTHLFSSGPFVAPPEPPESGAVPVTPIEFDYDSEIRIIFPICVEGWSIFRCLTTNVTASVDAPSAAGFAIVPIRNMDLNIRVPNNSSGVTTPLRVFRIDAALIDPIAMLPLPVTDTLWTLPALTQYISFIDSGGGTFEHNVAMNILLMIGYRNALGLPFDFVMDYQWPEYTSDKPLTNLQTQLPAARKAQMGFYPLWITDSYAGRTFWKTYTTFGDLRHVISGTITPFVWLFSLNEVKVEITPTNTITTNLSLPLTQASCTFYNYAPGGLVTRFPWAPGVFTQAGMLTYDNQSGSVPYTISFSYDVTRTLNNSSMNGTFYNFAYNPVPSADTPPWIIDTNNNPVGYIDLYDDKEHSLTLTLRQNKPYSVKMYRSFIVGNIIGQLMASVFIQNATKNVITFNTPFGEVNINDEWVNHPTLDLFQLSRDGRSVILDVKENNKSLVQYMVSGIVSRSNNGIEWVRNTRNELVFTYNGVEYTLFIGDDVTTNLEFNTTDIRDNTIRNVTKLDVSNVKMCLKQFWASNTDTENFWWIDVNHVLRLTKFNLELWEKRSVTEGDGYNYDDWDADTWILTKTGSRGDFFQNNDLYYTVSAAYNAMPILFKLQNTGTGVRILVLPNVLTSSFTNPLWNESVVEVRVREVTDTGLVLSDETGIINTLVSVDINALLCSGKISSTVTSGKFILGFQQTNGLQQWSLIFPATVPSGSTAEIVYGYGNVGHKGDLTGGQIPYRDCSNLGFKGRVYPLSLFNDATPRVVEGEPSNGVDNRIYCSGSTLYWVFKDIDGIVSHLTLVNGKHVPQVIPLKTNYHKDNGVSSYTSCELVDAVPRSLGIVDILTAAGGEQSGAMAAVGYFSSIGLPAMWYIQPSIIGSVFAAEGLHQAAYVWRNSLPVKSEDGASDKDAIAVRNVSDVSYHLNMNQFGSMMTIGMGLIGTAADVAGDELRINSSMESTATSDTKGRRLSQFVSQAIIDNATSAFNTKGTVMTAKVQTTEALSLSMFYTINDGCQCFAGPGFVNHQFIGQAVSQGISSTQFRLERYTFCLPLPFITKLLLLGQMRAAELAVEGLEQSAAGGAGGATQGGGLTFTIPVGWIVQGILNGVLVGARALYKLYQQVDAALPMLYQSLGVEPRGFNGGGINRNVIEPEATHIYGNKPVSFFWPVVGATSANNNTITVEQAFGAIQWRSRAVRLGGFMGRTEIFFRENGYNTTNINRPFFRGGPGLTDYAYNTNIFMPFNCMRASSEIRQVPSGIAVVEGITSMLSTNSNIKNLQVNCVDYTFPTPPIHDYLLSEVFSLVVTASYGEIIAYSMDDTKILDGPASNIVEVGEFLGIASTYAALELKNVYDHNYLRPWAITPSCIALNINGINCVHESQAYHGFDGQFNRIVSWKGGSGLDSCTLVQEYSMIVNNHFKRSNIIPPSEFFGKFDGPPSTAIKTLGSDRAMVQIMDLTRQKGLDINIPGEDRDLLRFSVPVHSEMLSTLPAVVRVLAPYKLHVVEGVTSLTTDVRSTQTKYKAPSSVDFNIYDKMYRATEEYVADLRLEDGVVAVTEKVPKAGLEFIGATTKLAFFYSSATRMYYQFSGGGDITTKDIFNRFRDIRSGRWDFVNQEVVFKCLLTDNILENDIDGNFILRLSEDNVLGEITPPNATIYRPPYFPDETPYNRKDFKILSMSGGLVFQGPKRCVVNRWVINDTMIDQIKANKKKWLRVDREDWVPARDYRWAYENWLTETPPEAIFGWTHNPWRAATAMLGIDEETDCMFEWELNFTWTEQINKVFEQNEYVTFDIVAETITQGGTVKARPTHIYLYKELFKNGYYSMRYTAKNGIGNRERLYMWCDGMVAVSGITLYCKEITSRRTQPIATIQVNVQDLIEQ